MRGYLKVLGYLCLGEIIVQIAGLPVPGPIVGLLIMLVDFSLNGAPDADVETIFDGVCKHLAILFVPAGAGLVAHGGLLSAGVSAILIAVLMGTVATMLVTALCFSLLRLETTPNPEETPDELCDAGPSRE
jgi:holin-like protein